MRNRIISAVISCVMALSAFAAVPAVQAAGVGNMSFDYEDTISFEPIVNASLEISSEYAHSGDRSLKISGRSSEKDGAKLTLESAGEPSKYNASVWVMSPSSCKVTATLNGEKINSANLPAKSWVRVAGAVNIDSEDAAVELAVYSLSGKADLYIDDVSVLPDGEFNTTPLMPKGVNMLDNSDFEADDLAPFEARSCTVERSADAAKDGKYGASVTGRTQNWNGIQVDIRNYLADQCQYEIACDFRMDAEAGTTGGYSLSVEYADAASGGTSYKNIEKFTATAGEWIHVSGTFSTTNYSFPFSKMIAYIESDSDNMNGFSVDNFTLSYYEPELGEQKVPLEDIPSLKEAYADYFDIGVAWDEGLHSRGRDEYVTKLFSRVTGGNCMKPDATQKTKGKWNFKIADNMVKFAQENGLKVHGHVMVWHEQTPDWFNVGLGREEALENMKTHIDKLAEHFGDTCVSWDVVNEAISVTDKTTISGILRDAPWKEAVGEDYILQAFKYADEAFPNSDLYYNDYNLDDGNKADAACTLVKYLRENGARIDGVGMQAHYNVNTSVKGVEESIEKFEALGLKIHISEMDVTFTPANDEPTEEEYIIQAQKYAQLFQVFKRHKDSIQCVTIWGLDDANSWRSESHPTLFDMNCDPKEAYWAVLDPDGYLEEHPEVEKIYLKANAVKGTPTIDAEEDDIWKDVPEYTTGKYIMAWQGASARFKTMWDENNIYIFAKVSDSVLSDKATDAYNQDSVEAFIDENNRKTAYYEDEGDMQYRVNYKNVQSFGTGDDSAIDRFVTATKEVDGGYWVEMAVPLTTIKGAAGTTIGFDFQVNDDGKGNGDRNSVAKFNDSTDLSWGNTENFGNLEMFETAAEAAAASTSTDDGDDDNSEDPASDITVILNGEKLTFDVAPMIKNDYTLVPFRVLLESLGATVDYDGATQKVTAVKDGTDITLTIGSTDAVVNGETKQLAIPAEIISDRTLIPLRFVSENLGATVDWDGATGTITITTE